MDAGVVGKLSLVSIGNRVTSDYIRVRVLSQERQNWLVKFRLLSLDFFYRGDNKPHSEVRM